MAYRPAVITFVDILGFTERVMRSKTPDETRTILRRLSRFAAQPDEAEPDTAAVVFSDSIVRVRFIDGPYRMGALFHEVLKLLQVQGEMLADDVLLRGGLTVGAIHVDGQMAFGPGFIRAYQLESQFANYPRVVIGPEVFTALRADRRLWARHHDLEDEVHYQRKMLQRGDDGFWFIDYLHGFQDEMDAPELHPGLVAQHRAHIIKSANAASMDSRILQKYLWLAQYLNDVVRRLNLPELAITQTDIPALEELADTPAWAVPYTGPTIGGHDFSDDEP
ncbi:MAG TPA: hypothetical protein VME40_04575 [Caulobacteraceae bacterium]|nr:hypothetical protein [Caulobacteraceae bacterium]